MSIHPFQTPSPLQEVPLLALNHKNITFFIKRDDLIHPHVSGNKWRKLKYNIEQALHKQQDTLLTFGGAHSNHITATAAAAKNFGLKSIGIIRGEDADLQNPTLSFAIGQGMQIEKISRTEFKTSDTWDYRAALKERYGSFHHIPQGGANHYGVAGCMEIVKEIDSAADRIFVACGTATTISGMALANEQSTILYGVAALKGADFLKREAEANVKRVYQDMETERDIMENVHFLLDFHFGGYAKITEPLIAFMRGFYAETGIKLDPVYTAKTAFAMIALAKKLQPQKPETWVLVHSGGLQGIPAMEERLGYAIYD